jgi:hypothetical protein
MKWWGSMLAIGALVFTALFAFFWLVDPNIIAKIWFGGMAILLWLILLLCYFSGIADLKRNLGGLIIKGERIKSRITGKSETDIDRCESMVQKWDEHVHKVLKGTEWIQHYESTTGLTKPESESLGDLVQQTLAIYRNWLALRLTRLKEIRDKLGY